jgi:predicted dehydrogenase
MSKPRVAILGASGIGKFHAREFKKAGADVVAILGTNEDSLKNTSDFLDVEYGIKVKSYSNIDILLASEKLDAVSICTPSSFHFEHLLYPSWSHPYPVMRVISFDAQPQEFHQD